MGIVNFIHSFYLLCFLDYKETKIPLKVRLNVLRGEPDKEKNRKVIRKMKETLKMSSIKRQ